MKRILSFILILSVICTLGLTPVNAEEFELMGAGSETFEALYTIPNIVPTVSNKIGVNQEEIKVYFSEALSSGIENITFTDSNGDAPIGGITVTADDKVVTVKFGELTPEETYTLSIPDTLESSEGSTSVAKDFTFVTLKKTFADADFSDSTVWTDGTYTAAQINAKGKVTAYFKTASKTVASVADSLLNVKNTSSSDTYLGINTGYMTTAKVVTFAKYKVVSTNDSAGTGIGSMWYSQFNTGIPTSAGSGNALSAISNGVHFSEITSAGFVKEAGTDLYDITVTSTYQEKSVSADRTSKTMGASILVEDNNSTKTCSASAADSSYPINNNTAKASRFAALKMYKTNSVSYQKIKQGFYTVPAPLGLPIWDGSAKTITYVMNTDIDTTKSSASVGDLPATLSYESATRKLTLEYTGDLVEGDDYNVSFKNVASADGLKGETEKVFNTVLLSLVSANPMNGSKIKAQAGTMTFVFSADVTKEELESNTEFYRKDNEEDIDITFSVAADKRTATMSYPQLANSKEYVLKMPKTFVFGGLEYEYITTGSNSIASVTPSLDFAPTANEVNPYLGVIRLEFNEPVTLDMANEYIKLVNETGVEQTVTITMENDEVSVWLPTLEAEKTYTFTVSDILLEEKCEILLDVQTPSELITTSPASGSTIDVNEREITVTFETDYTLSQIQNAITFVDDSGNAPKGGVYIRKHDTDPKKAILRFGRLNEKTNYHIVISNPITSSNIMFNYTTGSNYALDVDFDDWETGEVEKPASGYAFTKDGILFGHSGHALSHSTFEIKENADGTKYLMLKGNAKSRNVAVGYRFPKAMATGKFIVNMGIKEGSTGAEGFKNSSSSVLTHSTATTPGGGTNKDATGITGFSAFATNANGFYDVTAVLSKTETQTSISYTSTNNKTLTWGPTAFSGSINSVAFLKLYSNQSADDTLNLDYVKAYFSKDLDVINTLDGFDPKNTQLEMVFTDDVDESSLTGLKLTSEAHNVDLKFVSYSDRKAIFDLSEHLNYETDYEISVKDVKGTSEFEIMNEVPIRFKSMKKTIKYSGESVSAGELTVTLSNTLSEDRTYQVSIVLYDASGCAIKAKAVSDTISVGATNVPVTVTTGVTDYSTYKTFIWDITNGYYVPVK